MSVNGNKLREILLTAGEESLFEVVLDSFVDFFNTGNVGLYCIMEGRCYALYQLFKPFIGVKVDLESKKIVTDKTFLCVGDKIQGLLTGGKKLVVLDSCVYTAEHFNDLISEIGVDFEDTLLKSIFISDNIIDSNILAKKCEIGAMRDYSDRFWTAIMVCGSGNSVISVTGVAEYLKNFVEKLENICDYEIEKSKFELKSTIGINFTIRDMPRNLFKKLIVEDFGIRYFCAVPEKPFGVEINATKDFEKAKYMRSVLFSYDNGVFQFYPFVTLNIDENQAEFVELYEKIYGEYFPLPDTKLNLKTKLALERMSFLSGIELTIDFLKAVFDTEDIDTFKDFCKIENTEILFNNFITKNSLSLDFLNNLPQTGTVYNNLDAKKIGIALKNQKTLCDYFVKEFIADEDMEKYYLRYDITKLGDFNGFWSNEIDVVIDLLKADFNEKHLGNISIFECLKTFFTEKGNILLKNINCVVSALCFTDMCGVLIIDTNGTAHTGEGTAYITSLNYPYFAQVADIFSEKLGGEYTKNFENLEKAFRYFFDNYGCGNYNEKRIWHILLAARGCKATLIFARNGDIAMDEYEKDMLVNLSAKTEEFLGYCNEEKALEDYVEKYVLCYW